MYLLPLLCAKLFAPITALGTALATISGLPAGPDLVAAQPQLAAMQPPASHRGRALRRRSLGRDAGSTFGLSV